MPEDFALVVGIDCYQNPNLAPLSGAKNDAGEFRKWLVGLGKVKDTNIVELVSDAEGKTPRLVEVVDEVKKLLQRSPNLEERIGRRLYIFLAGHGVGPNLDEAGLYAADTSDLSPEYLPGRRYANLFRSLALFEEVVLCMDCCRDWDDALPDPYFPFRNRAAASAAHKVKKFYVFSTGFGRKARERDFGGTVHGVFTHALIEGLNGAASDGDGRITGAGLERYLRKAVAKLQPPGTDQGPDPYFDPDIVIVDGLPPRLIPVTVELSDPTKPFVVLYGKGLQPVPVPVIDLGGNQRQVQLPAGKTYLFRVVENGAIVREAGETVEDEPIHVQL